MWRDFTYGLRGLRKSPGFTAAVVLTLAVGIGANTAIFNLLDALVQQPLPVRDPQRLVRIGSLENNGMVFDVPGPMLDNLRRDPLLAGVCAFQTPLLTVEVGNSTSALSAHTLSGDCYETLGVRPAIGRLLTKADDTPNAPHVAVLSYAFWQQKFGGDPHVLGQTVRISGAPFQIVGVTEPRFQGLLLGFPPQVSYAISQQVHSQQSAAHVFYWAAVLARLKPGVTPQQLRAQLSTNWRRWKDMALPATFSGVARDEHVNMPVVVDSGATGVDYSLRQRFRNPLLGLLAISVLVLLVACMNVGNLLLARGVSRHREIAVRLALGAPRALILRQLLAESVLLAAGGFAAALLLSQVVSRLLIATLQSAYSGFSVDAGVNVRVLLFATLAALSAVIISGLLPAWQTSDVSSAAALKSSSRSLTGGSARARQVLISGQMAFTLVLVVVAGAFVQALSELRRAPLGFDRNALLDVYLMPLPGRNLENNSAGPYFRNLLNDMKQLPGVKSASLSSFEPLFNVPYKEDIRRLDSLNHVILQAPAEFISDGFLETMRIPLLRGRDFTRSETGDRQKTAIVSRSLAERLFGEQDALGRHIRFGTEKETRDLEIVGIAADARVEDAHGREPNVLYLNLWQLPRMAAYGHLQLRYSGPASAVAKAVRARLQQAGKQFALRERTIQEQQEISLLPDRLMAAIATTYGVLALMLAAIGLFGLLSFFIATRTGEIGLRMALGAVRRDIGWLVFREALLLMGAGVLAGLPLAYTGLRLLGSVIYRHTALPLVPLAVSLILVFAIAALAALVPVYRAGSIDPAVALSHE